MKEEIKTLLLPIAQIAGIEKMFCENLEKLENETLKKIFEKNNFRTIGIYSSWFSHTIGEFKVRKPCGSKNNCYSLNYLIELKLIFTKLDEGSPSNNF